LRFYRDPDTRPTEQVNMDRTFQKLRHECIYSRTSWNFLNFTKTCQINIKNDNAAIISDNPKKRSLYYAK